MRYTSAMPQLKVQIIPVTPFQQNCSFVFDDETKQGVVVDPGGDVQLIAEAIKSLGLKIEKILLTHGHIDHAGGAAELRELLGVTIEGPHKGDEFLLKGLPESGRKYGMMDSRAVVPDRWLEEGDTVEFAGFKANVIHAPGHSPGSVVLHFKDQKFALMGDVLFQGSIGRTDFPYGSEKQLLTAIAEKVLPLGDDVTFLPGHGPASTIGRERTSNPCIQRRS